MIYYFSNEICLFKEEVLDEVKFYGRKGTKYSIYIDFDKDDGRNFFQDPYIKIYDGINEVNSKSCIRIFLRDGYTTVHRGKKELKITATIADWINRAMDEPSLYSYTGEQFTVREAIWNILYMKAKEAIPPVNLEKYLNYDDFKNLDFSISIGNPKRR